MMRSNENSFLSKSVHKLKKSAGTPPGALPNLKDVSILRVKKRYISFSSHKILLFLPYLYPTFVSLFLFHDDVFIQHFLFTCLFLLNLESWVVMINQTHPKILSRLQMGFDSVKRGLDQGQSVEIKVCS